MSRLFSRKWVAAFLGGVLGEDDVVRTSTPPLSKEEYVLAAYGEPFPAQDHLPASHVRPASAGEVDQGKAPIVRWPMVRWRQQWWPVPNTDDIEEWLDVGISQTPAGDKVSAENPASWLKILNLT